MDLLIGIGIGILFCLCASLIWTEPSEKPTKRPLSQRADELPNLPETEGLQTYQDNVCVKCSYFDGYDICLRREHWGTIIQNTIEYCKKRKENEEKELCNSDDRT